MIKRYMVKEGLKNIMLKGTWQYLYQCSFFEIIKIITPMELKLICRQKKGTNYLIIESICFDKNKAAINTMIIEFNTALCKEGINFKKVTLTL